MEMQPPPQASNPYTVVHDAPKPSSIKVFGILNIVLGAMGLFAVEPESCSLFWQRNPPSSRLN